VVLIGRLCGAWASCATSVQLSGDGDEVIGEYGGAHAQLKAFRSIEEASFHSPAAEEHGDAPFDAGPEPLPPAEGSALFMGLALGRLPAAALGEALGGDPRVLARGHVCLAVEASVSGEELWRDSEHLFVMFQAGDHMDLVGRVAGKNPVIGDQADAAFREQDLMAELDGFLRLAPLDQVGMRLKDGEDLLRVGNLLALQDAAAGLMDDPIGQA
jgi:hypothetical protein